jgi:DNA replication protein DnaC
VDNLGDLAMKGLPKGESTSEPSSTGGRIVGKPGRCPKCDRPFILKQYFSFSGWIPDCDCDEKQRQADLKAELAEASRQAKADRIARLFEQAKLGARFKEKTFKAWQKREDMQHAFDAAYRYTMFWDKHLKDGTGMLMFGPVGTGKSHLAAAIVNELIPREVTAIFQGAPELLRLFRATYDAESKVKEAELMQALVEADLLVVDDIGAEKWTEYTEALLYQIIDARYRDKRPLVVTTNLSLTTPPLLETAIGPRALDRLIETCELIEVGGTSYRKEEAIRRATQA